MSERTWTSVGVEYAADGEARARVAAAVDRFNWEPVSGPKPMGPGLGIREVIAQLKLPRVSQVAISHELAPYGLYGIEANYKDGRARVYVVDLGSRLLPLASDFPV